MCLLKLRDRYEMDIVSPLRTEVFSMMRTASSYTCPGAGGATMGKLKITSAFLDKKMARSALPVAMAEEHGVVGFSIDCASTALVNAGKLQVISPRRVPCSGPPTEYIRITGRGK